MEQNIISCPKCSKEIGEVEFYKYHRRCKDCWNAYCKTKRYPNKEVNQRSMAKYKDSHPVIVRWCKKCKQNHPVENFAPLKHYCKDCYRTPAEIKKAYRLENKDKIKTAKSKAYKAKKVVKKRPKGINIELKKARQKKWYEARKANMPKKEKPIRIPKVKVERETKICEIKMTDTRVYPRVRDVRKGWDDTMAKLKLKFKTT